MHNNYVLTKKLNMFILIWFAWYIQLHIRLHTLSFVRLLFQEYKCYCLTATAQRDVLLIVQALLSIGLDDAMFYCVIIVKSYDTIKTLCL
jgi:hypothetical protein